LTALPKDLCLFFSWQWWWW